ncbi:ABC transporter substrate-binding protein [Amphibiibacter pelophylacis]|uniref:Sugar ABC transporter substrate-binding protein n=1 Tax=Amphibiibacter pelophylacis TaxID=1799477 RepID=A0ACC6NYZ4_9BURK
MKPSTLKLAALTTLALAGTAHAGEVKYMLWDNLQLPAYQQCAADFQKANPGTTIKITQVGWDDYWTSISTGMVSGTAPDVFTDHLAKYPEFARNNQLVDLAPLIAKDKVDTKQYRDGLYDIWGRDGKQYGLPKDWDTIGFIVNLDMAKKAGVSLADLQNMTWNPKDGGTFEQVVRKLTLDRSGKNATDPKFNPKSVLQYGYQTPPGGGNTGSMGQTEWSYFAVPQGFKFQDAPWNSTFHYDSPAVASTWQYLAGLPAKGLSAPMQMVKGSSADAMFVTRRVAMIPQGSWMVSFFQSNAKFPTAWVPLPKGASGQRASMINGLGDSIWAGSKVKDEAWKWVKYLGSADCQSKVASFGVVFPAIKGLAEKAQAVQKGKGVDTSAFLTMAQNTFLPPVADHSSQIDAIMQSAWESVMTGKAAAEPTLKAANAKVNAVK